MTYTYAATKVVVQANDTVRFESAGVVSAKRPNPISLAKAVRASFSCDLTAERVHINHDGGALLRIKPGVSIILDRVW